MVVANDLPYLEPLLFHLRKDPVLQSYFTEKSFFMPKHVLAEATEEAMKKDCPAPRALWILPLNSDAVSPKAGCREIANHTFNIVVFIQCIRDTFQLVQREGQVRLDGQYMELSRIRKAIKKSVRDFENLNKSNLTNSFSEITWVRDQNLYPDENNFLVTAMQYSVKIN